MLRLAHWDTLKAGDTKGLLLGTAGLRSSMNSPYRLMQVRCWKQEAWKDTHLVCQLFLLEIKVSVDVSWLSFPKALLIPKLFIVVDCTPCNPWLLAFLVHL